MLLQLESYRISEMKYSETVSVARVDNLITSGPYAAVFPSKVKPRV
jgi:hypothetical protein